MYIVINKYKDYPSGFLQKPFLAGCFFEIFDKLRARVSNVIVKVMLISFGATHMSSSESAPLSDWL